MRILISKIITKKDALTQWNKKVGNITTNLKVKIEFTSSELSAKKIVTWNFHVDDSSKGRYNIILGRDLLTLLGLNLKFSEHAIEADYGPLKGSSSPMVDLGMYELRNLNTGEITPEELFIKAYEEEIHEPE